MLAGMKRLVVSVVCAEALLLSACGGTEPVKQQTEDLGVSQGAVLLCDGTQSWNREYYSDPGYTLWAGTETCGCDGSLDLTGTKTRYVQTAFYACF